MIKASTGDYIAACGRDTNAGLLLNQMLYRCEHASVDLNGWYIRTRQQWMAELGLSKYAYHAAMNKLIEANFIEVAYTCEVLNDRTRRTMFRVTEIARAAVMKASNARRRSSDRRPTAVRESSDRSPDRGRHSLYTLKESFRDPVRVADDEDVIGDRTPKTVEKWFREAMRERDSNYFHGPTWSGKNLGFAKNLLKVVPAEELQDVVRTCVEHWKPFRDHASKSTTGKIPDEPNIVSLAMHATSAVEFTRARLQAGSIPKLKTMDDILMLDEQKRRAEVVGKDKKVHD